MTTPTTNNAVKQAASELLDYLNANPAAYVALGGQPFRSALETIVNA